VTQSPPSHEKKRKGGAPRVWTAEKIGRVCEELRKHRPLAIACRLQGHEPDSLEELMARDPEVKGMIEMARSASHAVLIDDLLATEPKDGASVTKRTWLLERLNPKAFRPPPQKVENEHTGKDGGTVAVEITLADARELAKG
jgi:hypothetical protein